MVLSGSPAILRMASHPGVLARLSPALDIQPQHTILAMLLLPRTICILLLTSPKTPNLSRTNGANSFTRTLMNSWLPSSLHSLLPTQPLPRGLALKKRLKPTYNPWHPTQLRLHLRTTSLLYTLSSKPFGSPRLHRTLPWPLLPRTHVYRWNIASCTGTRNHSCSTGFNARFALASWSTTVESCRDPSRSMTWENRSS